MGGMSASSYTTNTTFNHTRIIKPMTLKYVLQIAEPKKTQHPLPVGTKDTFLVLQSGDFDNINSINIYGDGIVHEFDVSILKNFYESYWYDLKRYPKLPDDLIIIALDKIFNYEPKSQLAIEFDNNDVLSLTMYMGK